MNNPIIEKTHFRIQLGASLEFEEGHFEIYPIGENPISNLESTPISESTFSVDLDASSDIYYCILLSITKSNVSTYSTTNPIQLLSVFKGSTKEVILNEPLTIATAFCYTRFITIDQNQTFQISGPLRSIAVAHLMRLNFMDDTGNLSSVISSSPNAMETNSYAMWNSLSNLLYYCLNNSAIYQDFLQNTSLDTPSTFFLQGLYQLILNPFNNVEAIYSLVCQEEQVYSPSLPQIKSIETQTTAISQWTLSIKVNDSGAQNFLIAGPGFLVFDKNDRAWVSNNVVQGTPNSGAFCTVLEPDGSPASFSPLFGGGLQGGGFGVTTDNAKEKIYFGNYGWGPIQCNPQTGGLSVFSSEGQILSPPNGFTKALHRVQGLKFDSKGNLWACSWGTQDPLAPSDYNYYPFKQHNSSIVVYLKGDMNNPVFYEFEDFKSPYNLTFDVTIDEEDNAIVSNSGNHSKKHREKCQISSIYKLQLKDKVITAVASWTSTENSTSNGYESFRQVSIDSKGYIYLAAMGSNRIIKFDKDLNYLTEFTDKIQAPWGIVIDADDTLWVSNFGKESQDANGKTILGPIGITIINEQQDDTANNFITLPSGGDEVLLNNGFPLYGNPSGDPSSPKKLPCHQPLMRLTSSNIDRCGNLWALNNWKPSAYIDMKENPGGDGIVIFIGVAPPMV